nr:hypothetical protein B0A51_03276 [Rachicladosporium sp. CCFEE 5018]
MVSVYAAEHFCGAIRITSYGGQGVSKPGVTKSDHCIVYTTEEPPERTPAEAPDMLQDEQPMQPYAIRIDPHPDAGWGLHALSRLDLADEQRVEYYFRVKNLGKVNRASMPYLETQLKTVREQKSGRSFGAHLDLGVEVAYNGGAASRVLSRTGLSMDIIQAQKETGYLHAAGDDWMSDTDESCSATTAMHDLEVSYRELVEELKRKFFQIEEMKELYHDDKIRRDRLQEQGTEVSPSDEVFDAGHKLEMSFRKAEFQRSKLAADDAYKSCIAEGLEVSIVTESGEWEGK